jgi:hypothetical protein
VNGFFGLVIFLFSAVAYGQGLYKCKDASGSVAFSDVPCAKGSSAEYINVQPANVLDSGGLRKWSERKGNDRASASESSAMGGTPSALAVDPIECENAKRDYNFSASYKFAKPGEKTEKKREYYRACGLGSTGEGGSYRGGKSATSLPAPPPAPSAITACDQAGCFDNLGNRYNKGAGNTYFGPNGACQLVGGSMQCP